VALEVGQVHREEGHEQHQQGQRHRCVRQQVGALADAQEADADEKLATVVVT
jgi:hypothetical protein